MLMAVAELSHDKNRLAVQFAHKHANRSGHARLVRGSAPPLHPLLLTLWVGLQQPDQSAFWSPRAPVKFPVAPPRLCAPLWPHGGGAGMRLEGAREGGGVRGASGAGRGGGSIDGAKRSDGAARPSVACVQERPLSGGPAQPCVMLRLKAAL